MSQPSPACPDCKVPMDSGFIVDFTYGTDASEVYMGRGNSRTELVDRDCAEGRQAAATDCDISLPEVRSAEIIRAADLTRVAADERARFGGSVRIGPQPQCRATVRPPDEITNSVTYAVKAESAADNCRDGGIAPRTILPPRNPREGVQRPRRAPPMSTSWHRPV